MSEEAEQKMMVEAKTVELDLSQGPFVLKHGGQLKKLEIAYEAYGKLNENGTNVILVCTPLTMDSHAAGWYSKEDTAPGWWDEMIGPYKSLDTNRYQVIVTNILGGCMGTTGPASLNPDTGKPYGSSFPRISVEDIVKAQYLAVKQLGVKGLYSVVGGSLGGMQAFQWSISYPEMVKRCVCIAAATQLSPQALGFKILGRQALLNDEKFAGGDFYDSEPPTKGLSFARMIGMLTYLSAEGMKNKFSKEKKEEYDPDNFQTGTEVESYLNYNGDKFTKRFDANSYMRITYAMDDFDLSETYGSVQKAFEKTEAEFLLVGLSSDWLFPPAQSRESCKNILGLGKIVSMVEIDNPYGHDGFLLDVGHLSQVIYSFLNKSKEGLKIPTARKTTKTPLLQENHTIYDYFDIKKIIDSLIDPGSHVLDIGCHKGELINYLYTSSSTTGFGIDIDLVNLIDCMALNVPVVHGDVDNGLVLFGDNSFDYAILDRTMQMLKKPEYVLNEMLRVAKKGIVVFPNFGNVSNRLHIALKGVMPITAGLPYNWWESPNIHMFTMKDFKNLCDDQGIKIEEIRTVAQGPVSKLFNAVGLQNLGGELVIAKISR